MHASDVLLDLRIVEICGPDGPWSVRHDLSSRKDPFSKEPANDGWADIEGRGCLLQGEQPLPLAGRGVMDRDA